MTQTNFWRKVRTGLAPATKRVMLWLLRALAYIPNLVFRILAVILGIVAKAVSILWPIFVGWEALKRWWGSNILDEWIEIPFLESMVVLGLVTPLLIAIGKRAWDTFRKIVKDIITFPEKLNPGWKAKSAFAETWHIVKSTPRAAWQGLIQGGALTLFAIAAIFLAFLLDSHRESNEQYQFVAISDANPQAHVAVVSAVNHQAEEIKQQLAQSRTTFSLIHLENANASGRGVCLSEDHENWLTKFKDAISQCVSENPENPSREKPEIEVVGFASSAPANQGGSNVNCEFANRRAEAVAAFLTGGEDEKWVCDAMEEADTLRKAKELCAPASDYLSYETPEFKLKVRQWRLHPNMVDEKPAYDGHDFDGQSYKTELFNRAVHINIPNNFCRLSSEAV